MKLSSPVHRKANDGFMLVIVLLLLAATLVALNGVFMYSSSNVKLNNRTQAYFAAASAAEAATEKVLAQASDDFRALGDVYMLQRLSYYRTMEPSTNEFRGWDQFDFMDLSGAKDRTEVQYTPITGFQPLGGQYGKLKAFQDRLRILSNARMRQTMDPVVASVYQDISLTRIPIFQYAIFYNVPLEFTPEPPMTVNGPVHCNTNIYMNPQGSLTFLDDVTCSGTIVNGPFPGGILPLLGGTVTYNARHDSGVSTLSLPIGTNNSPAAVRQVIEFPPVSEDPLSALGQQRYYNIADLIVLVSNSSVVVKSGRWNNFATSLSTNEVSYLVRTNTSFFNKRENKTVRPIQLDISKLVSWNATNTLVRPYLPLHDVRIIYVSDQRTLASTNESGVRLVNGTNLPPQGLTVATSSPLYIQGNYNCPASALGTTNTTGTLPASVAGDAITILSTAWNDTNGSKSISSRIAANTTVNAAILAGIVNTTATADSGGVENFPRYLEDWTNQTNTYNGSMVCMYNSQIANAPWGLPANSPMLAADHYNPPYRNWSLDQNFQTSTKMPPGTLKLVVLVRSSWRNPASFSTNVMAGF